MKRILIVLLILSMMGLSGCIIELGDGFELGIDDERISIDFDSNSIKTGDIKTYTKEIELGEQKSLDVELNVNAAEVDIERSEDKLFEGEINSNIIGFSPRMELKGDKLIIKDEYKFRSIRKFTNNWDLKITDQIPINFEITSNATKNDFDFTGLMLTDLEIYTNASDTNISFDEANEANLKNITIDINAGNIELYGLDNAGPEEIDVEVNAGNVTLEFGDNISKNIEIVVEGNASQTTLKLPENVGISIEKRSTLSSINLEKSGFIKENDVYKSSNYDEAEYKIEIEVKGTAFNLTVK